VFQTEVVEKIKTRILCWATFSENCTVYEIILEKLCKEGSVCRGRYNTAHALYMHDNYGYTYTQNK